jgi:hypothetical protein
MANIRIKDLSTTASTTASDDFFGVDGATNGTRKLNAYSPTFGGNLTLAGYLQLAAGKQVYADILAPSSGTTLTLGSGSGQTATVTGNLTVSGTGNSSIGGTLLVNGASPSGNGAIQLATHTTSAGGIGFGTALSIYRSSDNSAFVDAASGNVQLVLSRAGTANLAVLSDGSNVYASAAQAGMGIILRTNGGTTALTLDSSQRCILAGALRLNNAYTAGAPTATGYVTLQDSAGNTYKVLVGT